MSLPLPFGAGIIADTASAPSAPKGAEPTDTEQPGNECPTCGGGGRVQEAAEEQGREERPITSPEQSRLYAALGRGPDGQLEEAAPEAPPYPLTARTDYEDCHRCRERFFGKDARLWLNGDGVCAGCLSARKLRCPHCGHGIGALHSQTCAITKRRVYLTEVFVTDCDFPY